MLMMKKKKISKMMGPQVKSMKVSSEWINNDEVEHSLGGPITNKKKSKA